MLGQSLVLFLGHVRHALWIQVSQQGFHGSTKGMLPILYAVVFQQPQHAINIGCASNIDGIFGQFIHGGEIACQPMPVGEIETIAPGLEKGLTCFRPKAERHIIAFHITTTPRDRHTQKQKYWNQKIYNGGSRSIKHTSSPWIGSSCMWYKYPKEDVVMRMLLSYCLITVALGCSPVVALGDVQSHRKAAENLLIVMEVDKSLPKIAEQVVDTQLQQNPQLAPQREVLQRFLTRYVNWESVKEDTITAYTHEFTEPELKKLTEFYKTPVGKKASEKMPQLAFIAGQLGLKKAQANQAELRQMLEDQKSKPGGGG